jgi:hypothetical protein
VSRRTKIIVLGVIFLFLFGALPISDFSLPLFSYIAGILKSIDVIFTDSTIQWEVALWLAGCFVIFLILEYQLSSQNKLRWNIANIWLIALILLALLPYMRAYEIACQSTQVIIFFSGIVFAKAIFIWAQWRSSNVEQRMRILIVLFVVLLGGLALCQPHTAREFQYHRIIRWSGICDNPNTYGMLMGAGTLLAIALLVSNRHLAIILVSAILMMGTGLVMSYSRGAWLGTTIGLLYLANSYNKFNWRSLKFLLLSAFCFLVLLSVVCFFWKNTSDSAPWYIKRMDLSRPSAQHRVAAWKAGFEIMRDHPMGVGWGNTTDVYQKNYSPPPDGALAITTNDYLMLGTQLGIPALLCFLAYVALCFRKLRMQNAECRIKTACRAAVLSLLIAFWFDHGLFDLPTAVVFWILLELGAYERPRLTTKEPRNEGS